MTTTTDGLSAEDADTSNFVDLLLGFLGEESCLHDNWNVWHVSLSENLEKSGLDAVDHRDLGSLVGLVVFKGLFRDERPDLLHIDTWSDVRIFTETEVSHTNLTEVTRMVLVEVDTVVVLTTGITATSRVLAVLTDTTTTVRHVTAELAGPLLAGGHCAGLMAGLPQIGRASCRERV